MTDDAAGASELHNICELSSPLILIEAEDAGEIN